MRIEDLRAGDVVIYYHDDGIGGTLGYRRVVRVNRVTVTVETESGERYRKDPSAYLRTIKPHEWSPWNKEGL